MRRGPRQLSPAGAALAAVFLCGCREPDAPPEPGGGAHEVTHILLKASRTRLEVGEAALLTVQASWAIPWVEDVTHEATFELLEPELGEITTFAAPGSDGGQAGRRAAFVAKKEGEATVRATYRGFQADVTLTVTGQGPAGP